MRETILGNHIMNVPSIAVGCMRLADKTKNEMNHFIHTCIEQGACFFDHADIYGGGKCEELFGEYLSSNKDIRDKITVQTKCAIRRGCYDFSKEHILNSVNASLKRLKTDYIDVLLLHRPDTLMEPEEVAEAFNQLEREGKVRYFGVSNHNLYQIELLKTAVKQPIITNQLQMSITESGMITSGLNVNMKNSESVMHDGGLLEYSRIKNITIQTWSPFQKGFFEGTFIGDNENYRVYLDNAEKGGDEQ